MVRAKTESFGRALNNFSVAFSNTIVRKGKVNGENQDGLLRANTEELFRGILKHERLHKPAYSYEDTL